MEKVVISLFFAYLLLFPFGVLAKIPVYLIKAPEVNVYLTDLLVGLIAFLWWGRYLLRRKKLPLPPLARPIFLFSFLAALSLIVNAPLLVGREVLIASLYLLRWLAYASLYLVATDLGCRFKELKSRHLRRFLLVSGLAVAVFGLVQYFLWSNLKALEIFGWDPHFYRLTSTFFDPGFAGLILVLTLILIVNFGWSKKKKAIWRLLFSLTYLSLVLTHSRSSYLAYLISMGVIAGVKKAPKFLLVVFLLGLSTLLILPQPAGEGGKLTRTYSIKARIEGWQQALTIAVDHPLFGVGFNAYRYAQRKYGFLTEKEVQLSHAGAGADASLLFVLATTGILGFGAYLWLWGKIFGQARGDLIVLASAAAVLTHACFLNSLFFPWVMAWVWLTIIKADKLP